MKPCFSLYFYPIDQNISWSPSIPYYITCPYRIQHGVDKNLDKMTMITINKIDYKTEYEVEGYLCEKFSYITTCEESWFFSRNIIREVTQNSVSFLECQNNKHLTNSYNVNEDHFLNPECIWNSRYSKSKIVYKFKDYKVKYDPYNGNLIDSIFLSGRGQNENQKTIYKNTLWIKKDQSDKQICMSGEKHEGLLFYNSFSRDDYKCQGSILREGFSPINLNNACKMTFCGKHGFRISSGEWIELLAINETSKDILDSLDCKVCPPGTKIKLHTPSLLKEETVSDILDYLYFIKCQETISKLINGLPISSLDLSYLVQNQRGLGLAYKVQFNKLYQGFSNYEALDLQTGEFSINNKSSLKINVLDFDKHWIQDNRNTEVYYGLNGLVRVGSKIMGVENINLRTGIDPILLKTHTLKVVDKPNISVIHHLLEIETKEDYGNSKLEKQMGFFDVLISYWTYLNEFFTVWKVIIVIFICLILGIIIIYLKVCHRNQNLSKKKDNNIEVGSKADNQLQSLWN